MTINHTWLLEARRELGEAAERATLRGSSGELCRIMQCSACFAAQQAALA